MNDNKPNNQVDLAKDTKVPTPPKDETKVETVTVSKQQMDDILLKLSAMDKLAASYQEIEKKLNATVDRQKLDAFNSKQAKKVLPKCKISLFEGMIVLGWTDMIANKSEITGGREFTDQRTKFLLRKPIEDGKFETIQKEVDYVTSFQARYKEECEILSTTVQSDGNVFYKVQRADGEEIIIDSRFIN
jgi:hypothetical protein